MIISFTNMVKKYNMDIKGIIHVGAHRGQEIEEYIENGVQDIIMFEPVSLNFKILEQRMQDMNANISAYQVALGNEEKNVKILQTICTKISAIEKILKYTANNKNIYAFDSFLGLREDWKGTQAIKGTFDLKGKIPKLNSNVIPIKGWIQDTLPSFLLNNKEKKINFIHMDVDTYESTVFILKEIKPYLTKGSVILFDELYNYINWQENEYKALTEVFNESDYRYIAFSKEGAEVILEII